MRPNSQQILAMLMCICGGENGRKLILTNGVQIPDVELNSMTYCEHV
jgi:hypothetical protein